PGAHGNGRLDRGRGAVPDVGTRLRLRLLALHICAGRAAGAGPAGSVEPPAAAEPGARAIRGRVSHPHAVSELRGRLGQPRRDAAAEGEVIVEIVALLLAAVAGVAVARLIDRTATGTLLVGEGILLGIG